MQDSELLLEICVDSLESIRNAIAGGANRLELCSALSEGGLTPSLGLAKLAKRISKIPIFTMIRIRGGDFVYDPDEIDAMLADINAFKSIGIEGFVFGALTSTGAIDIDSCRKIISAAKPLPVTFHRAFDDTSDPFTSLDQICNLGFSRILTSGQKPSALEGVDLIAELVAKANNDIVIMPGAGITEKNIVAVRDKTRAREFHGSAKRMKKEAVGDGVRVGSNDGVTVTDAETVRSMLQVLRRSSPR